MTRRAMTAAFSPQDEPDVLCKIQYGILTAPKSLVIDAVSQRINRPSHEFAEHDVPDDYCIDVAMSSATLERCKEYRAMEDEMSKKQRESPVVHSEFVQSIDVYARNLEDVKISKRGLRLGDLSATGRKQRARERRAVNPDHNPFLQAFKEWLSVYEHADNQRYAQASVESYYTDARRWFTSDADIDDIYPLVKRGSINSKTPPSATEFITTKSLPTNFCVNFTKNGNADAVATRTQTRTRRDASSSYPCVIQN